MHRLLICFTAAVLLIAVGGSEANAHTTKVMTSSWYGPKFHGRTMANGDRFDMNDPTVVAHKSMPFGTRLRLRNPKNDKAITVTVQDRGPYIEGRHLDVSKEAARRLGFLKSGVAELEVEVLE